MRAFFRWLAKIIGSALTVILVVILFPYVSRLAARLLPDESGAAIRASAVLATKLENSARLETLKVEEDGVLNYDIRAAFIGSVAQVNVSYQYEASFGIDLNEVAMQVSGNELVFTLPQPVLIQDVLTPSEVYQDDFWYKGFTLEDYEKLLESERIARREEYLSGDASAQLWDATIEAFEKTIAAWLKDVNNSLTLTYRQAVESPNR
ncbi:MAG: DUF4230 domain-containing protein [Aristaeellaceae bacterium]